MFIAEKIARATDFAPDIVILFSSNNETTIRLLEDARLHVFQPTEEFLEFYAKYKRSSDVVESATLDFLTDPNASPMPFMTRALEKEAYKKPMDVPLSFIEILKLRTAGDMIRINDISFYNRRLEIEIDQFSPKGAPEVDPALYAIVEVRLEKMSPGSFHYSTRINPGMNFGLQERLPEGWEYSTHAHLRSTASGCTVVDPATNNVPPREPMPVRPRTTLSNEELDSKLDNLKRAKSLTGSSVRDFHLFYSPPHQGLVQEGRGGFCWFEKLSLLQRT